MQSGKSRHERVMEIHTAVVTGSRTNFVKRRKLFNNPFLLIAGVSIVLVIVIILVKYGRDTGLKSGLRANDNFLVYNEKIYVEYKEPVFGNITVDDLEEYLGDADEKIDQNNLNKVVFLNLYSSNFDMGAVYSLKNYSVGEWIVVQDEGRFKLLKYFCEVNDR